MTIVIFIWPTRAGMVEHPAHYRWLSYRASADGQESALITPHPLYLALGADPAARQAAHPEAFCSDLEPELIDSIRSATNGNFALGDERFGKAIARALGARATRRATGRPHK